MTDPSQKILYELRPDGNSKRKGELPFMRLLGGEEPIGNVKLRYNLYKRNWSKQMKSIENILNRADKFVYKSLKTFLCHETLLDDRLNTGLVHFGSNIANHSRLTKNVSESLTHKDEEQIKKEYTEKGLPLPANIESIQEVDKSICLVHLNSNAHTNMDSVLRAIENAVMIRISQESGLGRGKIRQRRVKRYEYNEESASASESDAENKDGNTVIKREDEDKLVLDQDNEPLPIDTRNDFATPIKREGDDNELLRRSRRIKKIKREQVNDDHSHRLARASKFTDLNDLLDLLSSINVRLVIFIENCDSMNLTVVHRLVELLWKFRQKMLIGLIIGISTPFEIFQEKLPVLLVNLLRTKTFSVDNSSEAINEIMEDLLLNINDTYNSLIFDPELVLDFLKRRDEISILQFYNYMKSIYMNHYFSEPMSIFWTKKFTGIELSKEYFQMFGRLPSVMKCGKDLDKDFLQGILSNDSSKVGNYLRINLNKLINWRYNFRNIFDFFTYINGEYIKTNDLKIWDNNLHLFQLIFTGYYEMKKTKTDQGENQVKDDSVRWNKLDFLDPIWAEIKSYSPRRVQHIYEEIANDDQFGFINNQEGFPENLETDEKFDAMVKCIEMGVAQQVKDLDLSNQLFKEICVIDTNINERLQMWFSPPIKDLVLDELDHSDKLLFNDEHWAEDGLDWEVFKVFEPSMCEIYRSYKDAGIVINVYDFYCVYKESVIDKVKMIDTIIRMFKEEIDEIGNGSSYDLILETLWNIRSDLLSGSSEEWDRMMLSWFLKGFQELEMVGLIQQKRGKTLSVERLVWKGV